MTPSDILIKFLEEIGAIGIKQTKSFVWFIDFKFYDDQYYFAMTAEDEDDIELYECHSPSSTNVRLGPVNLHDPECFSKINQYLKINEFNHEMVENG